MSFARSLGLFLSGGIVVGAVFLARLGLSRSALTYRQAVLFSSVGVGAGVGLFVYLGVGNGDLVGSIVVAVLAAFVTVATASLTLRSRR